MQYNQKFRYSGIFFSLLLVAPVFSLISPSSGYTQNITATPIQLYLGTNHDEVYQCDHFYMNLSLTNIYFEVILNVTLEFKIPVEVEFLNSSRSDFEVENDSTTFDYTIGTLSIDENVVIQIEYNVTSPSTKTVTFNGVNVSYHLINGIHIFDISNTVEILLKGVRLTSESTTTTPTTGISNNSISSQSSSSSIASNGLDSKVEITQGFNFLTIISFSFGIVLFRRRRNH